MSERWIVFWLPEAVAYIPDNAKWQLFANRQEARDFYKTMCALNGHRSYLANIEDTKWMSNTAQEIADRACAALIAAGGGT